MANLDSSTIPLSQDETIDTLIEKAARVVPSPRQLAWQSLELNAFIHFGVNTFTDREWGTGLEDPAVFIPTGLDARQWVQVLKEAGFKQVVLTAKHHDGFCLWPSRYTDFSVRSSPWRDGRGDVLRELADAAREAGIQVGFYLSPADLHEMEAPGGRYGNNSRPVPSTIPTPLPGETRLVEHSFTFTVDDYNRYYLNQLYELLTGYGPVSEVWFDGANPKPGVPESYNEADWFALVRALAPDAVMFQGPDIRWVGNETGLARETEWSVLPFKGDPDQGIRRLDAQAPDLGSRARLAEALEQGADYLAWSPAEVDVSIRPGWFYHASHDAQVKSLEQLLEIYDQSVGRNAVLLLNVPPDRLGRFADEDVRRLREFGTAIRHRFRADPALSSSLARGETPGEWLLELPAAAPFNLIQLQEDLAVGQRVEAFAIDAWVEGAWEEITAATTIGHKRLLRVRQTSTARLRLRILASRGAPAITAIKLFNT